MSKSQSDIDDIKDEIEKLEKDYKIDVDNLKKSEKNLKDTESMYRYFFFYTVSISIATLYLTRFIYTKMKKK
uniref:Uncharacterized protein n=1 Tax=viral metagenome TaxID=1070528 RepID=A0A6C0BRT0_9ZZZZ